jgi:hypothetical protein
MEKYINVLIRVMLIIYQMMNMALYQLILYYLIQNLELIGLVKVLVLVGKQYQLVLLENINSRVLQMALYIYLVILV